jgi:hypothetical protein
MALGTCARLPRIFLLLLVIGGGFVLALPAAAQLRVVSQGSQQVLEYSGELGVHAAFPRCLITPGSVKQSFQALPGAARLLKQIPPGEIIATGRVVERLRAVNHALGNRFTLLDAHLELKGFERETVTAQTLI